MGQSACLRRASFRLFAGSQGKDPQLVIEEKQEVCKRKSPARHGRRPGLGRQELLGGHWSWCWRWSAWAARSGKEGSGGSDDKEFNDFHDVIGCWLLCIRA